MARRTVAAAGADRQQRDREAHDRRRTNGVEVFRLRISPKAKTVAALSGEIASRPRPNVAPGMRNLMRAPRFCRPPYSGRQVDTRGLDRVRGGLKRLVGARCSGFPGGSIDLARPSQSADPTGAWPYAPGLAGCTVAFSQIRPWPQFAFPCRRAIWSDPSCPVLSSHSAWKDALPYRTCCSIWRDPDERPPRKASSIRVP